MRTLHLATSLSGGAGIAARRICEAQTLQGMDSSIIGGQADSPFISESHESVYAGTIKDNFTSSVTTVLQRYGLQNSSKLMTSFSTSKFQSEITRDDYDLIHIHANYNFINLEKILEISKRIATVITLHDQRYFTGGCHYSLQCNGYTNACGNCPQVRTILKFVPRLTLKKSVEAFEQMRNLEFIAPSDWMNDLASQSQVLGKKKIWTVANPVPDVFKPQPKANVKSEYLKIGFVSQNLNNPYKGLDVLMSAVKFLESRLKIELRLFGNGKIATKSISSVVVQKQFEDEIEASEAYNSCDVIIVPSIQDNFPSVVTEALSCGVPVIGSNTGGISEVLKMFGLPIFEPGDSISLANLIANFESIKSQKDYSKLANEIFSYKTSAEKHKSIYQEIVSCQ